MASVTQLQKFGENNGECRKNNVLMKKKIEDTARKLYKETESARHNESKRLIVHDKKVLKIQFDIEWNSSYLC